MHSPKMPLSIVTLLHATTGLNKLRIFYAPLTCEKFRNGEQTETDNKFFGDWKSFRVNYLKPIRRKRLES